MLKRSEAGLAVAILIGVAASILLIQAAEKWSYACSVQRSTGVVFWLFASGFLAAVTVILGRTMNVAAPGAFGVVVLGMSLGAVLKASGASDAAGGALVITVCFVAMAAAAAVFQHSPRSREAAAAITFWLLGACMLAGATWTVFSG